MVLPEGSGVLRQLIDQIDSEISTFQVDIDGFSTGQSLAGSSDSFQAHPGVADSQDFLTQPATAHCNHNSGTAFQNDQAPQLSTFTEQGRALFGDSSEWIQAELYRTGVTGKSEHEAPQAVPSSLSDQGLKSSMRSHMMADNEGDSTVPENTSNDDMEQDKQLERHAVGDEAKSEGDARQHGGIDTTSQEFLLETPRLLKLSFSNDDLASLIDAAGSFAVAEEASSQTPASDNNLPAQIPDSNDPHAIVSTPSIANLKYQTAFPLRHSLPLKKGFVLGDEGSVAGVSDALPAAADDSSFESSTMHKNDDAAGQLQQVPELSQQPTTSSESPEGSMEDDKQAAAVVPRKHGSAAFRDQVREERKRLSLVTTGVGPVAAASGVNNNRGSTIDLPTWELAPLSPPAFVKETPGASTVAATSTTMTTTDAPTTVISMRSPPPTRKLPPAPADSGDATVPNTGAAVVGDILTPVSATTIMTPTTPLSTGEARILAGREVLLRSSPESTRTSNRTASTMTTSSTASPLTTGDRQVPLNDMTSMNSSDCPMSIGVRTTVRQKPGMTALQYWKMVQDQELQGHKGTTAAAGVGVLGAIPGRGRMIMVYPPPASVQDQQDEATAGQIERNEDKEANMEGILKVHPERLVFPDQSIRPIPLKAFRVRKMTLTERGQAYAQACYEFSKARTGLDVWILRSMMQAQPDLMKSPPRLVVNAAMQKAQETSGRRTSFYMNGNHSWNTTSSSLNMNGPMSASTPTSAGGGNGFGFGSVSSSARTKIKNASKRLSMEITHGFSVSSSSSPMNIPEDGRRSSMSTHSTHSIKGGGASSSDKFKSGGTESPFYKQKSTKSAVELGSWSSQRARAFSAQNQQQEQHQPFSQQQHHQPQPGSLGSSGLSSSFGSNRDSFHQYSQQHQRQQHQQVPMQTSIQHSSTGGTNTSAGMVEPTTAGNRQRHSFSGGGPGANIGPGSLRSRTMVDLYESSSSLANNRHSFIDIGGGSNSAFNEAVSSNFNSVSGRRRSMMGPTVEENYNNVNNMRSSPFPSVTGGGNSSGITSTGGHKHEISRSTSASSLSSASSMTPTAAPAATMAPLPSNLSQHMSPFASRRRPMSMMVSTTLTSLSEHQTLTTESPISSTVTPDSMYAAGMVTSARLPMSDQVYGTPPFGNNAIGSSIPLADETTSKEIYSPLTSPIVIPEGGFNIPAGSPMALRAAAVMNSPTTPRESYGGGMARPLTFAGYGPSALNVSALALGSSTSSLSAAEDPNHESGAPLSSKSSKKKHDSLGFKKSFRRDKSDKRASKIGLNKNDNSPSSPTSPSSSVSAATGASMVAGVLGGGPTDVHGSALTMNMSEALWEQSLDKLADVLPHIDRDRLLIYLQRAGGDEMIAIGLAMSDLRNGDL